MTLTIEFDKSWTEEHCTGDFQLVESVSDEPIQFPIEENELTDKIARAVASQLFHWIAPDRILCNFEIGGAHEINGMRIWSGIFDAFNLDVDG